VNTACSEAATWRPLPNLGSIGTSVIDPAGLLPFTTLLLPISPRERAHLVRPLVAGR
jgi:hypothetical protein